MTGGRRVGAEIRQRVGGPEHVVPCRPLRITGSFSEPGREMI